MTARIRDYFEVVFFNDNGEMLTTLGQSRSYRGHIPKTDHVSHYTGGGLLIMIRQF